MAALERAVDEMESKRAPGGLKYGQRTVQFFASARL